MWCLAMPWPRQQACTLQNTLHDGDVHSCEIHMRRSVPAAVWCAGVQPPGRGAATRHFRTCAVQPARPCEPHAAMAARADAAVCAGCRRQQQQRWRRQQQQRWQCPICRRREDGCRRRRRLGASSASAQSRKAAKGSAEEVFEGCTRRLGKGSDKRISKSSKGTAGEVGRGDTGKENPEGAAKGPGDVSERQAGEAPLHSRRLYQGPASPVRAPHFEVDQTCRRIPLASVMHISCSRQHRHRQRPHHFGCRLQLLCVCCVAGNCAGCCVSPCQYSPSLLQAEGGGAAEQSTARGHRRNHVCQTCVYLYPETMSPFVIRS